MKTLYSRLAVAHAPKGGVTLQGKFYPGGQFIPGHTQEEVDKAAISQAVDEHINLDPPPPKKKQKPPVGNRQSIDRGLSGNKKLLTAMSEDDELPIFGNPDDGTVKASMQVRGQVKKRIAKEVGKRLAEKVVRDGVELELREIVLGEKDDRKRRGDIGYKRDATDKLLRVLGDFKRSATDMIEMYFDDRREEVVGESTIDPRGKMGWQEFLTKAYERAYMDPSGKIPPEFKEEFRAISKLEKEIHGYTVDLAKDFTFTVKDHPELALMARLDPGMTSDDDFIVGLPSGIVGLISRKNYAPYDLDGKTAKRWAEMAVDDFLRRGGDPKINAEAVAAMFNDAWARSSTNGSVFSVALQLAVADLMDTPPNVAAANDQTVKLARELIKKSPNAMRLLAESIYENTQDYLAKHGVKRLFLMRGMDLIDPARSGYWNSRLNEKYAKNYKAIEALTEEQLPNSDQYGGWTFETNTTGNPISSWSTDYETAESFAWGDDATMHMVLSSVIPAKDIFSTAMTGPGCLTEAEVLVAGGRPHKSATFLTTSDPDLSAEVPEINTRLPESLMDYITEVRHLLDE